MKTLQTLPKDKGFFDTYAKLIKTLVFAGVLAQIVSGLTEVGGINTVTLQALEPLRLGAWAVTIAAGVALLATLTIEIGLRQTFPKAIDAILFRRWYGLHLPMSVFVWLLSLVLLGASVWLSFANSRVIIENLTPEAEQITTAEADSIKAVALLDVQSSYQVDSTLIAANYIGRTQSTAAAYEGRIKAKQRELSNIYNKEKRTGNSYATQKDRVRQALANIEAEQVAHMATLQEEQAQKLQALNTTRRMEEKQIGTTYTNSIAELKAANQGSSAARTATVNAYGGGLGWFTIVCQFLFMVSVILDRIQRKGAGIDETIQIGAYDFRPNWLLEWLAALSERWQWWTHSKIKAYADATPAAPKPAEPGAVYDLAEAMQQITFKLELTTSTDENDRVIYLDTKEPETPPPPRQKIGFHQQETTQSSKESSCDLYSTPNVQGKNTKHEHETVELRQAKQRLKFYKKRLGSHQQKAIKQEQKKGKVCKRTANAVENNRKWVDHYELLIKNLKNSK